MSHNNNTCSTSSPIQEIQIRRNSVSSDNRSNEGSSSSNNNNNNEDHPPPAADRSAAEEEVERQLQDASERLCFVFPELRAPLLQAQQQLNSAAAATTDSRMDPLQQQQQQQQQQPSAVSLMQRQTGVLWKRRDVFKNRWRPRWFTLNPRQGVLTYYLLTASRNAANNVSTTTTTDNNTATPTPTTELRNRATSWDGSAISSTISENSLDYDVVPRGTIYLLGCAVSINEQLSQPRTNLYAFTIRPPSHADSNVHLAARSPAARDLWVAHLDAVCRIGSATTTTANASADTADGIPRTLQTPQRQRRLLLTQQHSIPEEGEQSTVGAESFEQREDGDDAVIQDEEVEEGEEEDDEEDDDVTWRSTGLPEQIFEHVPASLATRLQECLDQNLPLLMEPNNSNNNNSNDWKVLFDHTEATGHAAWQRRYDGDSNNGGAVLIQSTAILPDASPMQVFRLLWDVGRRHDYETNVRASERLQSLNAHTVFDCYAYHAVWPTAAREFVAASHWQVLRQGNSGSSNNNNNNTAIVMVSCSCPEADAAQPTVAPKHVRGQLHVSLYLLRPYLAAVSNNGTSNAPGGGCHLTRLLSFDLAGGVSQHLSNVICQQQARLPAVLQEYLERHEPVTEPRLAASIQLTNDLVQRNVVDRLNQKRNSISSSNNEMSRRAPSPLSHEGSLVLTTEDGASSSDAGSATKGKRSGKEEDDDSAYKDTYLKQPAIESQAVLLLAPTALYYLLLACGLPTAASLLFLLSAVAAIRQVVLWHLGPALPRNLEATLVGPVTCRFQVDLKGVLRFINNQAEAREEQIVSSTADVSVIHIVASAVARALRHQPDLHHRRTCKPWLGIFNHIVDASAEPVDVSVSENAGGIVTLKAVDRKSVQAIADELAAAEESTDTTTAIGSCLVLAMSNTGGVGGVGDDEIEMDAAPLHPNVAVVAVVGGVHLDHRAPPSSRSPRVASTNAGGKAPPPRPVLSLSLTIHGHGQADIVTCRRYAEEVKKLLQFPEMCEGE